MIFRRVDGKVKRKVTVRVKPSSSFSKVEGDLDGGFTVWVKSSPADGKANKELLKLLKSHLKKMGIKASDLRIVSGLTSRNKMVEIEM